MSWTRLVLHPLRPCVWEVVLRSTHQWRERAHGKVVLCVYGISLPCVHARQCGEFLPVSL